ncbi:MAG: hypothetical protein ACOYB2_10895 [Limnohabitans sp.]
MSKQTVLVSKDDGQTWAPEVVEIVRVDEDDEDEDDDAPRECSQCGSTETTELMDDGEISGVEQSITICAGCGSDTL